MMNFANYLKEVFDRAVPYTLNLISTRDLHYMEGTIRHYSGSFECEDRMYIVSIMVVTADEDSTRSRVTIELQDENEKLQLTNLNKDQFKAYSTIYAMVKQIQQTVSLSGFNMEQGGVSPRQQQMYDRLMKYFYSKGLLYKDHIEVYRIK